MLLQFASHLIFTGVTASVNNSVKTVLKSGKGTAAASKKKNTAAKKTAATSEGMNVM